MTSPFLVKLVSTNISTNLLSRIYSYHLLVAFFLGLNHDTDYDYEELYNTFLCYSFDFSKKITTKEVQIDQFLKDDFINLYIEFINDKNIINIIQNNYLINIFYDLFTSIKYLKHQIKEFNLYYTDIKYINYINTYITNKIKPTTICNLFSGFGKFIFETFDLNKKYLLVDENIYVILISYINLFIKNNTNNITFKINNIITDEITNTTFDLVLADLPDDIRNLIYTNCNTKIKFLKIRGTKSEPLIIQYITQILNKTGTGIIITPNSLLFGDSQQHINTRKYIFENFSVEVVDLDNKKSILIVSKIKNNKIIFNFFENSNTFEFSNEEVIKNNYSFYYYNYNKQNSKTTDINSFKLNDILNIVEFNKNNKYENMNILYSYKNNTFNINNINDISDADYLFFVKNTKLFNQNYVNNELLILFNNKIKNLLKGKTNQLNIDAINELQVNLPVIDIQNFIEIYINNNNNIEANIENQIEYLKKIKNMFINNEITTSKSIKISDICDIDHTSNSKNTIYINRNTINAGCVNLTSKNNETSTNNYYLHIKDNNILHEYLYFMLLYFENEFINMANTNKTITLSKKSIENFEIPIIDINKQTYLIKKINEINEKIYFLSNVCEQLKIPFSLFY